MQKILFVDDEPKVLSGLRRMLRSLRHEWDMVFVESGPEALRHLATSSFDVVVTDMRMPGMDGAQLLTRVVEKHPSVVRVVLSGQCDHSSVLKCVGPAHQFLTKPCDSDTLKSTVARACCLRDRLPDDWVREAISCVQSLPGQPSTYQELTVELASASTHIECIAESVSRDPAMIAKILQLVGSGFFGTPQIVSDMDHAVQLLGLETIRSLAKSTDSFFPLCHDESHGDFWSGFADHCLSVAAAAKRIAQSETNDSVLVGNAHLAGMLHDIGILVLAKDSPQYYVDAISLACDEHTTLAQAETRVFNTRRDNAGAYLMGLWGLPDCIVNSIAFHLSPTRSSEETFGPLAAVHVANAVMEEASGGEIGVASSIDMCFLERIGCADRLDAWRDICQCTRLEGVLQ